jgi:apolipoprotein N-acyltransferase
MLAAGAVTALAFAPWHILPLLVPGYTLLAAFLADERRTGRAFLTGWSFGAGFLLAGLYWIGNAFLVDAEKFAALMPFAVLFLTAGLALFFGFAASLATLAPAGWTRLPALAAALGFTEWLRGLLFTGFPWHVPGYAWTGSDALLQTVSLLGVDGLSPLTIVLAATPVLWWVLPGGKRRHAVAAMAGAAGLLAVSGVWGSLRLAGMEPASHPDVMLRLVQGGIPQKDKWRPELRDRHLQRYLNLSRTERRASHVIWPETATPFLLENDLRRRQRAATALQPDGWLISGTPRRRLGPDGPVYSNGAVALDRAMQVADAYDKMHLVPFGEYLPFRPLLAQFGLDKLAAGATDYTAGDRARLLHVPGLPPVRVLICYEILFPGDVAATARPEWLLNLSNDAWFGDGAGPRQHFQIARARAVEFGLPVVRVTNTGITAVINPLGRVGQRLELGTSGALDSALPRALAPTPYARFGQWILLVIEICLIALAYLPRYARKFRG